MSALPKNLSLRRRLLALPFLGPSIVWFQRLGMATKIGFAYQAKLLRWLFRSREKTNVTYGLTPNSIQHLASAVSLVCNVGVDEAMAYVKELEADEALRTHIRQATQASERRVSSDLEARYGRRAGWYAVVRALKPRVVVETGVDKGLGSVVLAAALKKNASEGHPGKHYGTDIDPAAGFLLSGPYSALGEVLYGDSIESLRNLDVAIDVFVNDSDHSADYERREYDIVAPKLSERAVIIGDNAHVTNCLFEFAKKTGRLFLYFGEIPDDHWYPGSGIGFAFPKRS